jgi:hypothetical protein
MDGSNNPLEEQLEEQEQLAMAQLIALGAIGLPSGIVPQAGIGGPAVTRQGWKGGEDVPIALGDLSDVTTDGAQPGDILVYDPDPEPLWRPFSPVYSPTGVMFADPNTGRITNDPALFRVDTVNRRIGIGVDLVAAPTALSDLVVIRAAGPQWGPAGMRLDAFRNGVVWENAWIGLGAPRSDSADQTGATRRAVIVLPGNTVNLSASMFLSANTANAVVTGPDTAIRGNGNSIEINSGINSALNPTSLAVVNFWRRSNLYASIVPFGNSFINTASTHFFGVGNGAPLATLDVGVTAATAYTNNLYTDGSNWERALIGNWNANVAQYGTTRSGTGLARDVSFLRAGVEMLRLTASGPTFSGHPVTVPDGAFTYWSGGTLSDDPTIMRVDQITRRIGIGWTTDFDAITPPTNNRYLLSMRALAPVFGAAGLEVAAARSGSTFNPAYIHLGAPRSDTADGLVVKGRGYIAVPGNSVDLNASIFIGSNSANAGIADAAAMRANNNSIELVSTGIVDIWRASANYARIAQSAASWINTASGHFTGLGNNAPAATLAVGTVAATAYTSNLATDASNFERCLIGNWSANVAQIGTTMLGTGLARDLQIMRGGTNVARWNVTGFAVGDMSAAEALHVRRVPNTAGPAVIRLDAYRSGATYNSSGMLLFAPRSDTVDGGIGSSRGLVMLAGDGVGPPGAASIFIATTSASIPYALDTAGYRASVSMSFELNTSTGIDLWRAGINYARLSGIAAGHSFVNVGTTSAMFGVGTATPEAALHVLRAQAGTTANSAYFQTNFASTLPDVLIVDQDTAASRLAFAVRSNAGATPLIAAMANGVIGIGHDAPVDTLSVGRTSATHKTYNLFTDASNWEAAAVGDWSANVARFGTLNLGTGVARDVSIIRGGVESVRYGSTGATFTAAIIQKPAASVTPANNGELMVEATSNTSLTFKFKGSDATVRSIALTLT